jgi:hypothetical protein
LPDLRVRVEPLDGLRGPPLLAKTGQVAGGGGGAHERPPFLPRSHGQAPAQTGLLIGVLIYDGAAAVLLAYAGLALNLAGIALWPAVVLHTALALWRVSCLGVTARADRQKGESIR